MTQQPWGILGPLIEISDEEFAALEAASKSRRVDSDALVRLVDRISASRGYVLNDAGLDRLITDIAAHGAADEEGEFDAANLPDRFDGGPL